MSVAKVTEISASSDKSFRQATPTPRRLGVGEWVRSNALRVLFVILRYQRGEKRSDARRVSAGIATPISSSRNAAGGRFSPRPKGAPQARQCRVTALGNRVSYSLRAVPCLDALGGALISQN